MISSTATKATCLLLLALYSFSTKAQLTTQFTASPITGCAPLLVKFTDQSTGNPTQWKWDLGNGTISFLQNPSVSYFNPGLYSIKLVIKNASGSDSLIKTQYINVSAKPTVQFTSSVTSGCFPLPVDFTDQSTAGSGTIASWQWDFGDGNSSTLQNPTHTYTTGGNFNVTLRVINSNGCLTTLSKTQYIRIDLGAEADFTNSVPTVCSVPASINFQNLSTGAGSLSYQWFFGDGAGSTVINPSHTYTVGGSYPVKLVVTNAAGCKDTLIKINAVTVGSVSPAFITSDTVCLNKPLVITNTSMPTPVSVMWSFGDGTTSTQLNPVKTFTTLGTYQIKMLGTFGNCQDSTFKTITVFPNPVADFSLDDSANCSYPFVVNFANLAVNATSYKWDFGDSTTSTLPNPTHTYNSLGNFNVQLVVTNANGCTDTVKKISAVRIIKPVVTFSNLPDSGCVSFTKTFTSTTNSIDTVTSYLWDFGDGTTSTNPTPTHTYNSPGIYPVTVIITTAGGCSDTATMARGIIVNSKPVAIFSATPKVACAKTMVNFTDESTGSPIRWLWDFGDGATSILQNPGHVFNDTGYKSVQLIIWNSGCSDTVKYQKYVYIKPPIARFIVAFDCSKPLERVFTDQSVGADTWNWDFGDGHTSTQQHPVHVYAAAGSYPVRLTVTNNSTGCDFDAAKTIQVITAKASFFASDTVICKGSTITFNTNLSLTEVNKYNWNFGDGVIINSTTNTATHKYLQAGTYSVRLITTDLLGCIDTLIKSLYIRVNGPTAKFGSSSYGSCLNNLIVFKDSSVSDGLHPVQSWTWNYGDGKTEILTAPPFQHNYATPGIYLVTLKTTDNEGCTDSFTLPTPLVISKPIASFKSMDTVTCPNKPVNFTNQSTGPNLNYTWYFGDGTTSIAQSPVHQYTADGLYSIKLVITDQYGCKDSLNKPAYISVITSTANFNMSDSFSTCPPLIVQFTNLSGNVASEKWDFGDGTGASIANPSHFYNYPGVYIIKLTVTGPGGCVVIKQKKIIINGPKGSFTYSPLNGCNPVTANFTATTFDRSSFIWDYSDGSTLSTTDSITSHSYTNPGSYIPKMILVDINGCQVPITGKDTITVNGVTANYNFLNKAVCDSGMVAFTDSSLSNDIITGYRWFLGDGSTSVAQNPQHYYRSNGLYYSKLIVTTFNGCVDSITSAIPVKVVSSPKTNMANSANGCTPLNVTFNGLITAADTSALNWSWTFGNGNISSLQNPVVQQYTVAGIYNVGLIVTNSSGCKDTVNKTIEAYLIPNVSGGPDTLLCNGRGITLQATGAVKYNWSPSTGLSCTTCANPVALPDSAMKYILTGTSVKGCTAKDTVSVKVKYAFKIKYSKTDTLCIGQKVKLFATGTDNFQWTPSTGLDNSNISFPTAQPDTTTMYRVVGSDNSGCFRDTGYVPIKVYPIPAVEAGNDKIINIGKTIDLTPVISADVTEVVWSPTGSIFRNTYPGISVKPSQTTEYTVEVKNRGGCMTRDRVSVFVICNGSNVFIPNTFSPNGDGANDVFYPRGTGLFTIKSFRIFNRWGEMVFEKNNFKANDASFGWDGKFKGTKLNADVFVYMIDILCDNFSILNYKGNVALVQ